MHSTEPTSIHFNQHLSKYTSYSQEYNDASKYFNFPCFVIDTDNSLKCFSLNFTITYRKLILVIYVFTEILFLMFFLFTITHSLCLNLLSPLSVAHVCICTHFYKSINGIAVVREVKITPFHQTSILRFPTF